MWEGPLRVGSVESIPKRLGARQRWNSLHTVQGLAAGAHTVCRGLGPSVSTKMLFRGGQARAGGNCQSHQLRAVFLGGALAVQSLGCSDATVPCSAEPSWPLILISSAGIPLPSGWGNPTTSFPVSLQIRVISCPRTPLAEGWWQHTHSSVPFGIRS